MENAMINNDVQVGGDKKGVAGKVVGAAVAVAGLIVLTVKIIKKAQQDAVEADFEEISESNTDSEE